MSSAGEPVFWRKSLCNQLGWFRYVHVAFLNVLKQAKNPDYILNWESAPSCFVNRLDLVGLSPCQGGRICSQVTGPVSWTPERLIHLASIYFFFLPRFCKHISCIEYVVFLAPRNSHLLLGLNDFTVQQRLMLIPASLYPCPCLSVY